MITNHNRTLRMAAGATLVAVSSVVVPAFAATVNPQPFVTNPPAGGPIGFTYAGNKFVGTILDNGSGQNLIYSTDLSGGSVQTFAPGPGVTLASSYGLEHYVSASLGGGQGGFPVNDVYVASGNNVIHISNNGATNYGNFITSGGPSSLDSVRGIAFDATGSWGGDMFVTTHLGFVYRVNSAGVATQIASTGEDTEGLDVAPLGGNWGGLNGALFVASENSGTIRAILPSNTPSLPGITVATGLTGAEQLSFVPLNLGASGSPLEGMYSANYAVDVLHAPWQNFTGLLNDIILTSEAGINGGTIWDLKPNGTGVAVNTVGFISPQPEDGIFVTADMVSSPEPASLALLSIGVAGLLVRRRRQV